MCGIVGFKPLADRDIENRVGAFRRLFAESYIRGLHAYGIADITPEGSIDIVRTFEKSDIWSVFNPSRLGIAHARYCQSGDWRVLDNNQPIVVGDTALAFNGCIHMGTKEEFEAAFDVKCDSDNDGEVFLRKTVSANAEEFARKAEDFVGSIQGSFAGVSLAHGQLIVSHNPRRPLWRCLAYGAKWYASTEDIFRRAGFTGMEPVPVGTEIA